MSSNLARRIAVVTVAVPAVLGVVRLGGWVLVTLLSFFGVLGTAELYRLAARAGIRPLAIVGWFGAAAFPVVTFAILTGVWDVSPGWLTIGGALWLLGAMTAATAWRNPGDRPLATVGVTLFGACYAGGLPAFLLALRHGDVARSAWAATWIVFLPLVVTWVCDSFAMLGGQVIGGPKLAPILSPKKTWAGAISGSASAMGVAPLYGWLFLVPSGVVLNWWKLAIFGLVVSIVGQTGDVAQSLFKREAGVKDSGTFFPGHGGILDRLDSLYWVFPTAVAMLYLYGTI